MSERTPVLGQVDHMHSYQHSTEEPSSILNASVHVTHNYISCDNSIYEKLYMWNHVKDRTTSDPNTACNQIQAADEIKYNTSSF